MTLSAGSTFDDTVVLTIDVEEDFDGVSGFDPDGPNPLSDRLPELLPRWLDLLERHGARATFFVLGRVAREHPGLVESIGERGHEVASHGQRHDSYRDRSRSEIRRDVERSRASLRAAGVASPQGFRAPQFSVSHREMEWFSGVLKEAGFRYDSSLIGPGHPGFGESGVPESPRRIGEVLEVPVPSHHVLGWPVPVGGSIFFRLFPYGLTRRLLRNYAASGGRPPILYFHPWELEPGRWELWKRVDWRARGVHFWGRWGFERKLNRFLEEYHTIPLGDYVGRLDAAS